MGVTVVSPTVQSGTVANDGEPDVKGPNRTGVASAAFTTFGTGPALTSVKDLGGGATRVRVTSGSGVPVAADNSVVLTLALTTRTPRKVFLAAGTLAPNWYVNALGAGTITIGTKTAVAASTAYDLDLIVLF